MSSTPSRRRQSVRPSKGRRETTQMREEASFDPFVTQASTPAQEPAGILKQSLLAQLNARVGLDSPGYFPFGESEKVGSPSKQAPCNTFSYENEHKRLFNSMKSIGSPRSKTRKLPESVRRNKGTPHLASQSPSKVSEQPTPKRTGSPNLSLATPSKRRKLEFVSPEKTKPVPDLMFRFDKVPNTSKLAPPQSPNKASTAADGSPPKPVESVAHNSPTKRTIPLPSSSSTTTTRFEALFPSTPGTHQAMSSISSPGRREEMRQKRQQKAVLERKHTKISGLPKPTWR